MLHDNPVRKQIIDAYDGLPSQLKQAARYILDHSEEVALVSMRELSKSAGVQPATMSRLAKVLGLSGFEELRAQHAALLRSRADGFAARALHSDEPRPGGGSLAAQILQGLSSQIANLIEAATLSQIEKAAERMVAARRVFVLGLRSCHSVAWHFHYVTTLLGGRTVHLDGPAGTSGDGLIWAEPGDVLLVVSMNPYSRHVIELTRLGRTKGLIVVAITDSEVSPLLSLSDQTILCTTESRSFFHTLVPALAVSEVLCALIAQRDRERVMASLEAADQHYLQLGTYDATVERRK